MQCMYASKVVAIDALHTLINLYQKWTVFEMDFKLFQFIFEILNFVLGMRLSNAYSVDNLN